METDSGLSLTWLLFRLDSGEMKDERRSPRESLGDLKLLEDSDILYGESCGVFLKECRSWFCVFFSK